MNKSNKVLIIGGGTAGIMVASQLLKKDKSIEISLIEPATTHYYQPAWTLVGAGTYDYDKTAKPMAEVMPEGVNWIKEVQLYLHNQQRQLNVVVLHKK